jgi:hypothetical protein
MSEELQLVTVFRSADLSAEEEATAIQELLAEAGLTPVLFTDDDPGVPEGAYEVRVPAAQEGRAEQAIAAARSQPAAPDDTSAMDLVTIFEGVGTTGEVEALSIRSLLDSAGIPSVLAGTPQIPNLPFLVKVPRAMAEQARTAIDAATAGGAAAAEEAERATEPGPAGEQP